jgi:sensor domain CHASE-containing protein
MMYKKNQEHCERKIVLVAISAAVLMGSFVIGSQLVQPSMAQDLEQAGQQAEKELAGAAQDMEQAGQQVEEDIAGGVEQ